MRELLEALYDTIAGHKSLKYGKIPHRDNFENITITDPATKLDLRGRLINLDLAKELESAAYRTSTVRKENTFILATTK